jgi:peptidoglycan/LPS O-acetylase OafA/YrhL
VQSASAQYCGGDPQQVLLEDYFMTLLARKNISSKTPGFSQTHELSGIEILRFICALVILIWHYHHFMFVGEYDDAVGLAIRPALPFYEPLRYAYDGGFWAVDVFWVISGFIFYWRYAKPIFNRRVGPVEFATRRFSRLYPLHIATLTIVALLQGFYFYLHGQYLIFGGNNVQAFGEQLLFASNWFKWQTYTFNGPIWSISVEILVYFVFFWIVRVIGPTPTVALTVGGFSWILYLSDFSFVPLSKNVFGCAVLFFAGGLAHWLSERRSALGLVLCAGLSTGLLLVLDLVHIRFSVIAILAMCFVLVFVRLGEMKYGSFLRRFAFLGNATYSSYLVHFPIQLGMVSVIDALGYSRDIFLNRIVFVAYIASVVAISLGVYQLFELPAQKWIRGLASHLAVKWIPSHTQKRTIR